MSYVGDGVIDAFPTGFRYFDPSHLVVELDGAPLAEGADYTATGGAGPTGGVVTVLAGPPAWGAELRITRTMPLVQETSFRTQGEFSPRLHEDALDALTMQVQQVARDSEAIAAIAELEARMAAIEAGVITPEQAAAIHLWQSTIGPTVSVSDAVDIGQLYAAGQAHHFTAWVPGWKRATRLLLEVPVSSAQPIPSGFVVTAVMAGDDYARVSVTNTTASPVDVSNLAVRLVGLRGAV